MAMTLGNRCNRRAIAKLIGLVTLCLIVGCDQSRVSIDQYGASVGSGDKTISLTAYENDVLVVTLSTPNIKQIPSFAIAESAKKVAPTVEQQGDWLRLTNGQLRAEVNRVSLAIKFFHNDQLISQQKSFAASPGERKLVFSLKEKETIFGAGQRIVGMDRRGHRFPLYNRAHYGYTTESNQMYYSLPAVMSSEKYFIAFDNSASGFMDIGYSKTDQLQFESVGGRASYIISAADSFPELVENYVEVTGKQPMPARWLFGNHASRFGYRNQQEVESVVNAFREADIPVDSVIIDLFWFGPDIKGHMGNLAWDKQAFPEPKKMIASLKQQGVKTILITEPFILSSSKRWDEAVSRGICAKNGKGEPKRFDFYFGNTCLIDVFDEKAIDWFQAIYIDLMKQGVAGTWGDLGEPEVHPDDTIHTMSASQQTLRGDEIHNAYGHQWANLVYQSYLQHQPDTRPMIMMRSGFLGTQRYGIIPWTGDVDRSWGGLKPQVELSLQMSLFGLAYTHSDLGGFAGGETFDQELYLRWLQYGVFQPVYRPHAQDHIAPEPVFHDEQTKAIARDFIRLRYRLLPYHYTMAYQNSTTGMPLMRPVFFQVKQPQRWLEEKRQYFWGESMMVKPVTQPGLNSIKVDLPQGTWFDFFNGTEFQGEQTIDYPLTLQTIPVLVKAGAFIPMTQAFATTEHYSSEQIELHYYHHDSVSTSQSQMYEDDGKSSNSLKAGLFELLEFRSEFENDRLSISFERSGQGYQSMPQHRQLTVKIHNWSSQPEAVEWRGEKLTMLDYRPQEKLLTLVLDWDHSSARLNIE